MVRVVGRLALRACLEGLASACQFLFWFYAPVLLATVRFWVPWRRKCGALTRCAGLCVTVVFPVPPAKLIIIASNCPPLRKSEIEYYAMLSKTEVHHFTGGTLQPWGWGMPTGLQQSWCP